ncbi:DNA-binding response OmpR family regulator [Filimonas zeae]|uniref:Response regulatory domain-containing protein n=1 Tax=Filimonas zeae TaxID=1737353 RepID=A0A917ITF0_9BACT|nr:response regulator [Filimonas zeae]MDR6339566.1 DNA-binding response OmpR family regulator [Filimonas zeae]GGH63019.1 hypothetical protein GCM10011379_13450 [Filimonas zeae]
MINTVNKKRLLLIDDDRDARTFVMLALCKNAVNCECVQAGNVTEAMKLFPKTAPDLIFLDYQMPGLNGLDFLTSLRKQYPESTVPIVFYSAVLTTYIKQAALSLGVQAIIRPGAVATIARLIKEYFG